LSLVTLVSFAHADEFRLSNNSDRCSAGLRGKLTRDLQILHLYFNVKTSNITAARCRLSLTRDKGSDQRADRR